MSQTPLPLPTGVQLETTASLGEELTIRRYRLDNGLGLITVPDHRVPIIAYQTWYRVGSRDEQEGKTGMAHLFEHLMFNQTETLGPGEFDRVVEELGGESNAATWVDWTYYRLSMPARALEVAVRLESERMHKLVLDDEVLATEREVVINERLENVEDDVDGLLDETLFATAFDRSPYRWPTIGWMEDIRRIARPDIEAFYRAHYAPDNATVIVVGDFDERALLDLIVSHYGALPRSNRAARAEIDETPITTPRSGELRKPVIADRLVLGYRAPGQRGDDWAALELLGTIMAGGPSARLYRRLVIETEFATGVQAGIMPFRDDTLFRIAASAQRGHAAEALRLEIDSVIDAIRTSGVTAAELARAKNMVATDFWTGLADIDGKAEALGHYETNMGDFSCLFDMSRRLAAVSLEDVHRVAATYLAPETVTAIICRPSDEGERDDDDDSSDDCDDGESQGTNP